MDPLPTTTSDIEARIAKSALILAALLVAGCAVWLRSWIVPAAVAVGALLAWFNFRWLGEGVAAVVLPVKPKEIKYLVAKFLLRLALIGAVFYVIIRVSLAGAMGLLAGLSVYVLALMLEAIRQLFRAGKTHART